MVYAERDEAGTCCACGRSSTSTGRRWSSACSPGPARPASGRCCCCAASGSEDDRARGGVVGQPARVEHLGRVPARPSLNRWSTWWPATWRSPGQRDRAQVQVAAEQQQRPRRPARAPRSVSRSAHASRCVEACRLTTQPSSSRTAVRLAPLGPPREPRRSGAPAPARARGSCSRRRRWPSAGPAARLATARRSGSPSCATVSTLRPSAPHAAASAGGHHGGTSCSSATSHSHPASAAANSPSRGAPGGLAGASVVEVPGQCPHPTHFLTGAELDASRLDLLLAPRRRAEGEAARLARAGRPHGRAAVPAAVDPHARVVRGRRLRARRPPDGPARRRAAAHPRRVGARHGARPVPPRGGDRPAHGRRRRARRRSPSTPRCRWSTCSRRCTTRARRWPTCSRCARRSGRSRAASVAYVGDGNNVARSLAVVGAP